MNSYLIARDNDRTNDLLIHADTEDQAHEQAREVSNKDALITTVWKMEGGRETTNQRESIL